MKYELCPSILSADFNILGTQLRTLEKAGIRVLHIDVMDGDFVPSISFGMPVIRSIRKESGMFFDVHLMVREPARYIREFADCGADSLTVHVEACEDPEAALRLIRSCGIRAGISIKPGTPVSAVSSLLPLVDLVLVMTVEPGFGGQKYIEATTEKIREVRRILTEQGLSADIQVDGGINLNTIETVMRAGANWLVSGSTVFAGDIEENVRNLTGLMEQIEETLQ